MFSRLETASATNAVHWDHCHNFLLPPGVVTMQIISKAQAWKIRCKKTKNLSYLLVQYTIWSSDSANLPRFERLKVGL
jgi:hypothetical protein